MAYQFTAALISFYTLNDDKRSDTVIAITVTDRNNREVARSSGTFGKFADESNTTIPLSILEPGADPEQVRRGVAIVEFKHTGNVEWHCNFHVQLTFHKQDGKGTTSVTGHS